MLAIVVEASVIHFSNHFVQSFVMKPVLLSLEKLLFPRKALSVCERSRLPRVTLVTRKLRDFRNRKPYLRSVNGEGIDFSYVTRGKPS